MEGPVVAAAAMSAMIIRHVMKKRKDERIRRAANGFGLYFQKAKPWNFGKAYYKIWSL